MAKPVTMDEIAAQAGVSRGAVSLALRGSGKISAKTTEHILSVARLLGYRPNLNASRLARSDYSTFGLLVSDLHNPIMADILDGFALSEAGQASDTYLASGFNSADRERMVIEGFLAHRVKGIVLIGSLLPDDEIIALARLLPVVAVGRRIAEVDSVLVDDDCGGRLAAEHLLELGHKRIAHIDGGQGAGAIRRRRAFEARVADTDPIIMPGDYTQEGGAKAARELFALAQRPTAIFAANDLSALGVLSAARECGVSAGDDFALIGFDDITLAAYDYISLSSISYARSEMGRVAQTLVQRRCSAPETDVQLVELTPTLVRRKTSGERVARPT